MQTLFLVYFIFFKPYWVLYFAPWFGPSCLTMRIYCNGYMVVFLSVIKCLMKWCNGVRKRLNTLILYSCEKVRSISPSRIKAITGLVTPHLVLGIINCRQWIPDCSDKQYFETIHRSPEMHDVISWSDKMLKAFEDLEYAILPAAVGHP